RTRRVQRAQQASGFLVNIAIQLLRMALTQPFEGMTPGRIGVNRVSHDRWMVVAEMHQLLGLAEDGLTEERQRAGVRPVNIRADQGQVLPQENSGSIG